MCILWHCWMGVRKSIRPVKIDWWGVGVVICLELGAKRLLAWSSWCHCIPKPHHLSSLNIFFRLVKHLYEYHINHNQTLFTLTFRSLSETFVRRRCSILLPVLATVVTWSGPSSLASFKSRLFLTFWYRLTQVVLEKRPLNGIVD